VLLSLSLCVPAAYKNIVFSPLALPRRQLTHSAPLKKYKVTENHIQKRKIDQKPTSLGWSGPLTNPTPNPNPNPHPTLLQVVVEAPASVAGQGRAAAQAPWHVCSPARLARCAATGSGGAARVSLSAFGPVGAALACVGRAIVVGCRAVAAACAVVRAAAVTRARSGRGPDAGTHIVSASSRSF